MGLFSDTVPRDLYDQKCREYDALLEKYHSLRMTGQAPVKPMTMRLPKPDGGTEALRVAEAAVFDPIVRGVAENLMRDKPGLSEADALREAKRLHNIMRGRDVPPPAAELSLAPVR